MRLWSLLAIWLSPLWSGAVFGQSVLSHSGQVQGWEGGEADIIPIPDVNVPFYRLAPPPDASSVGTIAADGTFTISIPEGMAPVQLRPAGRALTGCSLDADPEDARVVWLEYGAHRADGRLIGIIFRASAPAWGEAEPGEH